MRLHQDYTSTCSKVSYPVNEVPDLGELAEILCCNTGSFPTSYLGLPQGAKFKVVDSWNGVIERFERKQASWELQYISMGGRLTLTNSTLDSIPTYLMSSFLIPNKVLKQLDKIRRDFLWEGNNGHKFHLIKWSKCTMPKLQGGPGIKDVATHKQSLLVKSEMAMEICTRRPTTMERDDQSQAWNS